MAQIIPTILCGGAGSRLWPLSREMHPKPFIRLGDGLSLLQKAFLRGAELEGVGEVHILTNREVFFKTEEEIRAVNQVRCGLHYVLEPFGRNTAAAIAIAALSLVESHGREVLMLVMPADHLIEQQEAFAQAVVRAAELAVQGRLVTFGIRPESPETGYGYIEADGDRVVRFVEKPGLEKAREYLASGRHFWNSGMFCFSAGVMLDEMARLCPDIVEAARRCLAASARFVGGRDARIELDAELFQHVPDNSIDYAVMEKSAVVSVVPCDIGWRDIGSWTALSDLDVADADGNTVQGKALLHGVRNCHIRGEERIIGAVGVESLIIVDTPDAVLVAHKDRAQDVKQLYTQLKAQGHDAYKVHRTVHRPWGEYTVLEEGERYKIKRIVVKPGASLSLQMHYHRSEHWIVVGGMAKVVNGEQELFVNTNESTYIPAGHRHRLENPGVLDLVMIEVQSGDYLGEDDIVRFVDNYGRV